MYVARISILFLICLAACGGESPAPAPAISFTAPADETVAELVRADERLKKEFPQITLPALILHGIADKVTNPDGSQLFYDTAGSVDETLKLCDGHVHDLLNDYGKEQVMKDITTWIAARVPAA